MDRFEALNIFRSQHDDERFWLPYEWEAHDKLLAKVEDDNGRDSRGSGNEAPDNPGISGQHPQNSPPA